MKQKLKPAELEQWVRQCLAQPDRECLRSLEEGPARHYGFGGLTWLWGPELFSRDAVLFRPLLLAKSSWMTWGGGWNWSPTPWSPKLESWLAAVEQKQDVELCQRLLQWKLLSQAGFKFSRFSVVALAELRRRWESTPSAADCRLELRKLDIGLILDEDTALQLYRTQPKLAAPYILKHLPRAGKKFWNVLFELTCQQDQEFAYSLYRALVPAPMWLADIKKVCAGLNSPSELVQELRRRSPQHLCGESLAQGLYQILQARGQPAMAYVIPELKRMWKPLLGRGHYGKILQLAEERGWTQLWSATLRVCGNSKEFNGVLRKMAQSKQVDPSRLLALSGVSREWNLGTLGLAQVHLLECDTAVALYRLDPTWLRGPFKAHLQVHPHLTGYVPLLQLLIEQKEDELVDVLASRFLLSMRPGPEVELLLGQYRQAPRRAANCLGKLPAFSVCNYAELMRKNPLARLLFERSLADYAQDPQALGDLVEASEIHVMALGYRCLAQAQPASAAGHLELLLGCLFRPLQHQTRSWALAALERASQTDVATAAQVLEAAREAQRMPDLHYPKEALWGLLGKILAGWPQLQRESERPVVYRRPVTCV